MYQLTSPRAVAAALAVVAGLAVLQGLHALAARHVERQQVVLPAVVITARAATPAVQATTETTAPVRRTL